MTVACVSHTMFINNNNNIGPCWAAHPHTLFIREYPSGHWHCTMEAKHHCTRSLKSWPDVFFLAGKRRYMIIHKGCIYYFTDSNSSEPKGNFSLQGYRFVFLLSTTTSQLFEHLKWTNAAQWFLFSLYHSGKTSPNSDITKLENNYFDHFMCKELYHGKIY